MSHDIVACVGLFCVPLISVVTPVHPGRGDLLAETAASVAGQVLPAGWDLEWLVQEDGGRTDLAEAVSTYPFAGALQTTHLSGHVTFFLLTT